MNYHYTKDVVVSGFIDSSNENASTCFCLMSDSLPKPDNIFTTIKISIMGNYTSVFS
jgi:hypothetical protein